MRKHSLALLLFLLFVFGCKAIETIESTKVNPSEISQLYQITSAKDKTSVNATFYARGATVDLDVPSSIEFNGKEMNESKPFFLKGTDYNYYSNKFESSFQFAFHTADGKIYQNEVRIEPLEIVSENLVINRSQKNRIQLSRAVAENETVTFTLRSADVRVVSSNSNAVNSNSAQERYETSGKAELDSSRTSFVITSEHLENVASGKAYLSIEVSKNSNIEQSTGAGGSISASYESRIITMRVAD